MKKIDNIVWDEFRKSGRIGYYMLYNALNKEEDKNGKHNS
jgi:hypothetical protein